MTCRSDRTPYAIRPHMEWRRYFTAVERDLFTALRRRAHANIKSHAVLETYRATMQDLAQLMANAFKLEVQFIGRRDGWESERVDGLLDALDQESGGVCA